ncbi:pseudouridine synthase [Botryobacter ruber]|uniref:pseudouridine synthase n=1 Tax=Botryobacter ruber TaxID=2171629 RepID=UPI000E0BD0A8|nr:pseudouridine synthase [Botryobacter ruber]
METHRHFIIHKPFGYLSQFVSNQGKQKNKNFLGSLYDFPEGIMSVGRLDEDSEGLLLLTTDGKVSELVRSREVEKEYYVQVDGDITGEAIALLQKGVDISIYGKPYKTLPCQACRLDPVPDVEPRAKKIRDERHGPTSWVAITITEGKFRQVRKMTAAVGFPTLRLIRVRIGGIRLEDLGAAQVVEVKDFNLL